MTIAGRHVATTLSEQPTSVTKATNIASQNPYRDAQSISFKDHIKDPDITTFD